MPHMPVAGATVRDVAEEPGRGSLPVPTLVRVREGRMYCTSCGAEVDRTWKFCAACAAPIATSPHDGPETGDGDVDLVSTTGVPTAVTTAAHPAVAAAPVTTSAGGDIEHGTLDEQYRWLWWVAGVLAFIAAGLHLAALFPEYYGGGES